jgi:multidrug efflux pump subunit AcrB
MFITEEIGRSRVLKVILDKDKMAENGIDPMGISQMIQANNSSSPSASFVNQDEEYLITTGKFLTSADDVENLVVGLNKNRPVYLRQVASVQDGPSTAKSYVFWLWKTNDNYKVRNLNIRGYHIRWKSQGSGCNENFGENS